MRKLYLLLMGVVFLAANAIAQRTITGRVTDEKGAPLANVSVMVKGTNSGTITRDDGSYTLALPSNARTLVFSSTDMTPVEMNIGSQSVINATLNTTQKTLSEV